MFCTSLRKRAEWASVPSELLAAQQRKWKEQSLNTHDLAIPMPRHKDDHQQFFLLLLLSPSDLQSPETAMTRVERLYHQTGGRQVGIVFLLQEKSPIGNGTISYMNLQTSLLPTFEMPIIPLFTLKSLQDTLFNFQQQLIASRRDRPATRANPATTLLPYCSLNPPIPEHPRNIMSDVCHTMGELAQAATSREGQAHLRNMLSEPIPAVAEDIIAFWEQEFLVG